MGLLKKIGLLLLACLGMTVSGQNLNFIHYNSNNSKLPHDVVYSACQSREGYLWICTDDGIVRFDGSQMRTFEKGLSSRYTIALHEDAGQLWLSTWKGGIHRLRGDSLIPVHTAMVHVLNTNRLLVKDSLFIAYSFSDYVLLQLDSNGKFHLTSLRGTGSNESFFSPGITGYLHFLKRQNGDLIGYNKESVFLIKNNEAIPLANPGYNRLTEDRDGRCYGLRGQDIFQLGNDFLPGRRLYQVPKNLIPPEMISYFYVLPTGNIVFGNEPLDGKPIHYVIDPFTHRSIDLVAGVKTRCQVSSVSADREGSLWLCTDGDGVYHIFDPRFQLIGPSKLHVNPHVTALCYDPWQKKLVVGTRKGILAFPYPFSEDAGPEVLKENFFSRGCFPLDKGVGISAKGFPTIASQGYENGRIRTLDFFERKRTASYLISVKNESYYTITSTTGNGKVYVRKESEDPFAIGEVAEDDHGRLWMAAENQLHVFDWQNGWRKSPSWQGGFIHTLLFEPGKGLWIAAANGLYLLSENGAINQWTEKQGLHNTHVNCLYLQEEKGLWLGTQNGLYLLDKNGQLHLFKKRNGLISDEVLCFAPLPDGYLAVGSSKGLSLFYTHATSVVPPETALLIDEIKIDGEPVPPGRSSFEVNYKGAFEISVNAITFLYPELLLFEYRLNPSDAWISTKNRSIILTHLEAGTYQLAIRVKKPDAGYSEPVMLSLKVSQPWWQNTYFYLLIITLLAALSASIIHTRSEKQRKTLLMKKEQADLKLKSLLTQLNPHFVSNALNAIQFYILNKEEANANHYLSKFASLTRLILESSRHRFITLKLELEILREYLSLEKMRFENRFDYSIQVDEALYTRPCYLPGIVVQPFAENSINHGILYLDPSAKGQLDVLFLSENNDLLIRIEDNGVGRKRSKEVHKNQVKNRTSLGGSIVQDISQTVNELPGCYMDVRIIDKEDESGNATGTRVDIRIRISPAVIAEENSVHENQSRYD